MNSIFRTIVFFGLFTGIGLGQTQLDAFEHFATGPAARVVSSKEVDRIDTDRAHAVITAVIVEDASSNPQRMRGVRIDLSDGAVKDQVYTGADFLERIIGALNEIVNSQGGSRTSNTCFGSCQFRQQPGHAFSASSCFLGDWHGLVVSTGINMDNNTGNRTSFRFTNVEPSSFAVAIGRARDELK